MTVNQMRSRESTRTKFVLPSGLPSISVAIVVDAPPRVMRSIASVPKFAIRRSPFLVEGEPVRERAAHRVALRRARGGEARVDLLGDERLRAVGVDPHDTATRVGRPERPVGLGEDALRPLQIAADERDRGRVDAPTVERVRHAWSPSAGGRAPMSQTGVIRTRVSRHPSAVRRYSLSYQPPPSHWLDWSSGSTTCIAST